MKENFKKLAVLFDTAAKLSGQIERNCTRPVFDAEEYKMLRNSLDGILSQISVLMSEIRNYEYQNK